MDELIVAPDAAGVAISHLDGSVWPWPVTVVNRRPNPTVGRIVVVRRSGGTQGDLVTDAPFLTFECFADTPKATADLAMYAYALVRQMAHEVVDGIQVYWVQVLAGPADLYDADAQRDRYVFSVQAQFRASAV